MNTVKKGEIYYADLNPVTGSEQGGVRPVVIIQNDTGNFYSPTTIIAAITSRLKTNMPTHVYIENQCLPYKSVVLLEHIRTIDKSRLKRQIGELSEEDIQKINRAALVSLDLERTVIQNEI